MTMTSMSVFAAAAALSALAAWWTMRGFARGGAAGPGGRRAALAVAALGALAAFGLYAATGRPNLAGAPYQARLAALKAEDPAKMSPEQMLAILAERARIDRTDPRPHIFTGQILAQQGKDQEAARAFQAALRRDPQNPAALLGLGRVAVQLQAGAVSPEALALFEAAAAASPSDPTPWLYQALAATQDRRWQDAQRLWPEVDKRLAPDDPRHAMVAAMIAEARRPPAEQPGPEQSAAAPGGR